MITIQRYNPSPRAIWHTLYRQARKNNYMFMEYRRDDLRAYTVYFEWKYNIDSDYLMATMGNYALSIT